MFKKKPVTKPSPPKEMPPAAPVPKYKHPKILLIDLDPEVSTALQEEGYNVASGTFGTPYKVHKDSGYQPVVVKASLPKYTEQEIIVLDLVADDPKSEPPGEKIAPARELDWWAKCNFGEIDPRPRAMAMVQKDFDRILESGGAFIIFADSRDQRKLVWARDHGGYNGLSIDQEISFDNWSFLSLMSNLTVGDDHGEEIHAIKEDWALARLLADHVDDATFCCTFEAQWHIKDRWGALAKNKYGSAVAGVIVPPEKTKSGWVFVLPRIKDKVTFLAAFLKNVLPGLCPGLFPHAEGQKWVHRPEYELPSVLEKAKEISDIQDEAAKKVSELEQAIEDERNACKFHYDLIRETGSPLVAAVMAALDLLGFESVIDVDEEMTKAGKQASLREDLRIHDASPILVVDVKGVAGTPADAESLQAQKHAFIYIQENNRADVRGLTIINHQRLLPPLERENRMPYRQEILDNAAQVNLGLMTGWDLFRLVRGFVRNYWKPEHVKPLFYQTGRILPVPLHYELIGKVKQVWKPAFSVDVERGEIRKGDRIAVEFPVDFHEQEVTSLRLNDAEIEVAKSVCEVGLQRDTSMPKPKPGMLVYRIKP